MKRKEIGLICASIIISLLLPFVTVFSVDVIDSYLRTLPANDRFYVCISSEYKEQFLTCGINVDIFNCPNLKDRIYYDEWYYRTEYNYGVIVLYLEKGGKQRLQEAMEQVSKLDFVLSVSKVSLRNCA